MLFLEKQQYSLFSCIPFHMRWHIVYCNQGSIHVHRYIASYMTRWHETVMRSCGAISRGHFTKWYESCWPSIVHSHADMHESKRHPQLMPGGDAAVLNRMTTCCGIRTVKARELDDITRLLLWNMQNGAMNTMTTNQPVSWPRQRNSHVVIPPVAQAAKATNTVIKLGSAV